MTSRSVAIRLGHLATAASVLVLAGCSGGGNAPAPQPRDETDDLATAPETVSPGAQHAGKRTTVACRFGQLVGVVLNPEQRRVEILETNQEFAGDTGLPPTGTGTVIAALSQTGLTFGNRCRIVSPPKKIHAAPSFVSPYPEKYATWLRCGLYGSVLIDAAPIGGGYRLTIGGPPKATVLAHLLLDQTGDIAFADPTCRRFVVTDNVIP